MDGLRGRGEGGERLAVVGIALLATGFGACGGGGDGGGFFDGGGGGGGGGGGEAPVAQTVLTSTAVSPELGGLLAVTSDDPELDGFTLDVPPRSVSGPTTLSVGTPDALPQGSPLGAEAVGKVFEIGPSGTQFADPATLTLPLPGGDVKDVYVSRWDPASSSWEDLGGTVDGDFVSVDIEHLSTYAVQYRGKSRVVFRNASADPIVLFWDGGPVPPDDFPEGEPFAAHRPISSLGAEIEPGAVYTAMLLPGAYHFIVSYPTPNPGVANTLELTIPVLASGADDATVDQTVTIDRDGATSDDASTNASIAFPGASSNPSTNQRPRVRTEVIAPPDVPVSDAATGGPVTETTQIVNVGPLKVEELEDFGLYLRGYAQDPEGAEVLHVAWTWSWGTLPSHYTLLDATWHEQEFFPNPTRAGLYTVYFTAYDDLGLFNEGRFQIQLVPNTRPTLSMHADETVIDFGRLDAKRRPLGALPTSGPVPVCAWIDTDGDGIQDSTLLRTLPETPDPVNPDQDPTSLTCIEAHVFDADDDELEGGFRQALPLFGRGNFYAAIAVPPSPDFPSGLPIGAILDTYAKLDAYNENLLELANAGALPVDAVIYPDAEPGTQALPILWEAPDDPDTPTDSTSDCSEFAGCQLSNGGTVNLEARVTDGYSVERREFQTILYPDDQHAIPCQLQSVSPNPPDPGPGQGVTVVACVFPQAADLEVEFSIEGSDGYSNSATNLTDAGGCASFFIPGGAEGVVDHVRVECGNSVIEVTYVF